MRLEHTFTVPIPVDRAWDLLLDLPEIAPCMPGAALTDWDGSKFAGTVKVKLGPVNLTYRGTGEITSRDDRERRVVVTASGRDARGAGNASAVVTAELDPDGDGSRVSVVTELTVSGRPAQFGRGMIAEVSAKLLNQFAACLAEKFTAAVEAPTPVAPEPVEPAPASPTPASPAPSEVLGEGARSLDGEPQPVDLLALSGAGRVGGYVVMFVLGVLVTLLVLFLIGRLP